MLLAASQTSTSKVSLASGPSSSPLTQAGVEGRREGGEFSGATYHVLVEKIENHVGKSGITPVPVDKE